MERRVVITGMGAVTPLGNSVKEYWNALVAGSSGVSNITKFDAQDHTTKIAAEVKNLITDGVIDARDLKRFDDFTIFSMVAAHEAMLDSGLDLDKVDRNRIGVIVGSGIGGISAFETEHSKLINKGPRRVSPFFIFVRLINLCSGQISIRHGLKGPNHAEFSRTTRTLL